MRFVQICGDWLFIARRQTAVIAVLCRGFVNDARTVKTREDGRMELINTPYSQLTFYFLLRVHETSGVRMHDWL